MSYAWWFVVILLTSVVVLMGMAYVVGRGNRPPLERLPDPVPMPDVRLPSAGLLDATYGPFPVDTTPLLLWSEQQAAVVAHEREVRAMIVAAEDKIPPRWR